MLIRFNAIQLFQMSLGDSHLPHVTSINGYPTEIDLIDPDLGPLWLLLGNHSLIIIDDMEVLLLILILLEMTLKGLVRMHLQWLLGTDSTQSFLI